MTLHLFLLTVPRGGVLPLWNPRHVPSGSNTGAEYNYFHFMWANFLHQFGGQHMAVQWSGLIIILAWVLVLSILIYLEVTRDYYNQNKRGAATDPTGPEYQDLYPVESYNGVITERNGGVSWFQYVLYAVLLGWGAGIMFYQILNGQPYGGF